MNVRMLRDKDNTSDVFLQLVDDEAKEWFGRMERFIENKRLMYTKKGIEKKTKIEDLDDLFNDFKENRTQLCSIEERWIREFLLAPTVATIESESKEEDGEIVITTRTRITKKQKF